MKEDLKDHSKLIQSLAQILSRPWAFINPLAAEQPVCFISGIVRGYLINCHLTHQE